MPVSVIETNATSRPSSMLLANVTQPTQRYAKEIHGTRTEQNVHPLITISLTQPPIANRTKVAQYMKSSDRKELAQTPRVCTTILCKKDNTFVEGDKDIDDQLL